MEFRDITAPSLPGQGERKDLFFESEIATLMYAFGDEEQPAYQSVELMEKYMHDYIFSLLERASWRAGRRGNTNRVNETDIKYCLRTQPRAYHRLETLLKYEASRKKSLKVFDPEDGKKKRKRAKHAD